MTIPTCNMTTLNVHIQCFAQVRSKGMLGRWSLGAMEPDTTLKLLTLPHFHIKAKSVLKEYSCQYPYVC